MMKGVTTAIVFDHRGRAHGKQEGPLELRYTVNRKAYYLNTGVRVRADEWYSGKVADIPGWAIMDERIKILREKLEREVNRCLENNETFDPKRVRERIVVQIEEEGSSEPFIEWAEDTIKTFNVSYDTKSHYETLISRLRDFGGIATWGDLTPEKIMQFDAYLRQLPARLRAFEVAKGIPIPRISSASVMNYHKMMRSLIRAAVRYGRMERSPYERLVGAIAKGEQKSLPYLPQEDLEKIERCHPTDGSIMEVVRDLFLLQSYTGLSYADLQAFDISKYRNEGGVWRATIPRKKTGVDYVSQLLPQAVEILQKYKMTVPHMDRSWYNQMLKVLGETLGIKQRITSHMGRHTFATMMLRKGVRIEHVSKMLGHTNITMTQRYAKVLADDVYASYDEVAKKSEE